MRPSIPIPIPSIPTLVKILSRGFFVARWYLAEQQPNHGKWSVFGKLKVNVASRNMNHQSN